MQVAAVPTLERLARDPDSSRIRVRYFSLYSQVGVQARAAVASLALAGRVKRQGRLTPRLDQGP